MIVAATADRRRHGSPVVRNTYQSAITRHDLNHQHRWSGFDTRRGSACAGRQARSAQDDLYKAILFSDCIRDSAARDVSRYAAALKKGFALVARDRLLTTNRILDIHHELVLNDAGIRKVPGTEV